MIAVPSLAAKAPSPEISCTRSGPPPLTGVPNGIHQSFNSSTTPSEGSIRVRPQYELEEIDKVVIHKQRRRLSECSNEQKRPQSDPNPVADMAKVCVVSKRAASTESAELATSPKGGQTPKRRKSKLIF